MVEPVPLLSLRGISKSFGRIEAVKDIDLDVFSGEIVALVGDNGAGKSTLIKIVTGVYQPSAGQIFFKGKPVKLKDVQASR
jgi:D-xylose transport system ATP-binding protein